MPRNMSFALTTEQFLNRTKDVTRRLGWDFLQGGELLWGVKKAMGLQKGEKIERLGLIKVVSVTVEPLSAITKEDVGREGFPDWSPQQFVEFFSSHNNITPDTIVNRIEFCYVTGEEGVLEVEEIRRQVDDFWLHNEKTKKEIERIDTAVKHAQLSLDVYRGKYVLRTEMALHLEALGKELDRICKNGVAEMITLVGGNQQKAPELLDYCSTKKVMQGGAHITKQ